MSEVWTRDEDYARRHADCELVSGHSALQGAGVPRTQKVLMFQRSFVITALFFGFSGSAFATETPIDSSSRAADAPRFGSLMLETDPATFAFNGYSAHLRVAPAATPGWVFGAGMYGLDLPAFVPGLHPGNRGDDLRLDIEHGTSLFVDHHFARGTEGTFIGLQTSWQRQRVSRESSDEQGLVDALLLMPRFGYLWKPATDLGFYLLPWAGVGASLRLRRSDSVPSEYHHLPVLAFATLHVGWEF
jgi:hypothetical protein